MRCPYQHAVFQDVDDSGWWKGELNGTVGVFPDNFVELLPEEVISLTVVQYTHMCNLYKLWL